jgi:hypothetical protein
MSGFSGPCDGSAHQSMSNDIVAETVPESRHFIIGPVYLVQTKIHVSSIFVRSQIYNEDLDIQLSAHSSLHTNFQLGFFLPG